jgi:hypothetical protein
MPTESRENVLDGTHARRVYSDRLIPSYIGLRRLSAKTLVINFILEPDRPPRPIVSR